MQVFITMLKFCIANNFRFVWFFMPYVCLLYHFNRKNGEKCHPKIYCHRHLKSQIGIFFHHSSERLTLSLQSKPFEGPPCTPRIDGYSPCTLPFDACSPIGTMILKTLSFLGHLVHWIAYVIILILWRMWKDILGFEYGLIG